MFTVGDYSIEVNENIKKGLVGKSKGGCCFFTKKDAIKWGSENLPNSFRVYELSDDAFMFCVPANDCKYPSKMKLTKTILMKYV